MSWEQVLKISVRCLALLTQLQRTGEYMYIRVLGNLPLIFEEEKTFFYSWKHLKIPSLLIV